MLAAGPAPVVGAARANAVAANHAAGQSTASRPIFRSGVELVTLAVTVDRPDGQPRRGLAQHDFRVYEEGIPQNIVFFGAETVPVDLVLVLDASSSMTGRMSAVKDAASHFIHALRPIDRAAVMTIGSRIHVLQSFSRDARPLDAAIASAAAGGNTALYDGLYVALKQFGEQPPGTDDVRRRAVVVLSDGADTASLLSFDDVLNLARRSNTAIYPISIVPASEQPPSTTNRRNADVKLEQDDFDLRLLASDTGGRAFVPTTMQKLGGVYASIARELANQYSIGYMPALTPAPRAFRRVTVAVDTPDVVVRTRRGYIGGD
jgi:Ca-activated chloride channel family protein